MPLPFPGEVRLWSAAFNESVRAPEELSRILSVAERERAAVVPSGEVRTRFVLCRGILRSLLGRLLGLDPSRVRIELSRSGKPGLAGPEARSGLRFSLSHTRGAALFGFCRDAEIGVDLERLRPAPWGVRVAGSFFGPAERAFLESRLSKSRDEAFLVLWTMKEAYLKARGEGLAGLRSGAEVLPAPGLRSAELRLPGDPAEAGLWTLRRVAAGKGLAASVAVRGTVRKFAVSRWTASASGGGRREVDYLEL